jgi:hypothetical protein
MTQQNACNALLEALPTQRQIVAELCRREQRPEQVVRQQERPERHDRVPPLRRLNRAPSIRDSPTGRLLASPSTSAAGILTTITHAP